MRQNNTIQNNMNQNRFQASMLQSSRELYLSLYVYEAHNYIELLSVSVNIHIYLSFYTHR